MSRFEKILHFLILGSLIILAWLGLVRFYDYPGLLPDSFLAGINNLVLSVKDAPSKVLVVNLMNMSLDTFEDEGFRKRYPVLAAGNPRTCPTPTGDFQVLTKYDNVMSSLSHVWMPWSMRFYQQYYIHEVPYYPSGAKVTSKYSLGCLRLAEGDAQEVFEWADLGSRVKIIKTNLAREEDQQTVYYLTDQGLKKPIPNQEVFAAYGYSWADIAILSSGQLEPYADLELIRGDDDYRVYKLENGQKRWITSIEVFEGMGYQWSDIWSVNQLEIEAWPTGRPIFSL